MGERCLVVPRESLQAIGLVAPGRESKFTRLDGKGAESLYGLVRSAQSFRERDGPDGVEQDPAYKQIIPYVYVLSGDRFLIYRRNVDSEQYHEARLAGRISLGLGGHVKEGETVEMCLYREFKEEAQYLLNGNSVDLGSCEDFHNLLKPRFVGIIDDERDSVGQVHVGFVFEIALGQGQSVHMRGNEHTHFEYVTAEDFIARRNGSLQPEGWSNAVFDACLKDR